MTMDKIIRNKSKKKGNFLATIFLTKNRKGERMPTIFLTKNRKGWIEIVEAFVAVLLVAGVILIMLNRPSPQKTDISDKVYQAEISILREIQTNDALRTQIINAAEPMPIAWSDARFPIELKSKITARTPDYLSCIGKICNMTEICVTDEAKGKEIYAQAVSITSTLQTLAYRKLNLFCWAK